MRGFLSPDGRKGQPDGPGIMYGQCDRAGVICTSYYMDYMDIRLFQLNVRTQKISIIIAPEDMDVHKNRGKNNVFPIVLADRRHICYNEYS